MDDTTLDALETALAATPENAILRLTLARARAARGEWKDAARLLAPFDLGADFAVEDRRFAATVALAAEDPERALTLAPGDEPADRLLRARALAKLERSGEARAEYDRAVAESPALEDRDLAARLSARLVPTRAGEERKLRLVANDDTDREEVRRLLAPEGQRVTFADVGGLDEVKEQIRRKIVLPFQKPSLFQKFRKRAGGGILLYGPPGCGKTLLARATAGECGARFLNVEISDVLDMYIGESERKLAALFDEARRQTPSVLFFDEIEALGGKRQYHREATAAKLVSQFLAELDGFAQNNQGVLVLGATNVPWAVDPAFRRPGRFDRVLFVPPPDRPARRAILELALADRPVAGPLPLDGIAERSSGFSGADLAHGVDTASDFAIADSIAAGAEVPIGAAHLDRAFREVKPTTLEWLTTARNYARYANEGGQYDDVLEFLRRHGKA